MALGFKPKPKTEDEFISEELQPSRFQDNFYDVVFLFARLFAASMMVHHGYEKILSPKMFAKFTMDKYFGFMPGDHVVWSYIIGYVQLISPILVGLGVFSRIGGAGVVATMLGAIYYALLTSGFESWPLVNKDIIKYGVPTFHNYGFETPSLYIAFFALVFFTGPGKFSISQLLGWNDDKSLLGKLKQ